MRKAISLFILLVILVTACKVSPTPDLAITITATAETDPLDAVRAHIERLVAEGEVPSMAVAVQDNLPQFLNAGGGPFLRGWMRGELETADVNRGRPYKLWLELKLRENVLNGSLIVFSQREIYTGPLAHWVELRKRAGE